MQLAQDLAKAKIAGGGPEGVWDFSYDGGSFTIELRPAGVFFCKDYPAHAHWEADGNNIAIDWGKFGKYSMVLSADGKNMDGSATGNTASWRKASKMRDLTAAEFAIMGTEWTFEYDGGSFNVEFHGDGHFNCPDYPAHSHWSMAEGDQLSINWGKYGDYDLKVDGENRTFAGSVRNKADNWRKGSYVKELPAHDHSSCGSHDHGDCGHDHGKPKAEKSCCETEKAADAGGC